MSAFATCPACDQKVTAKPGKSSGKCPACGAAVSFAKASATGKSSRRGKDDEDDDDRKPAKAKPKRKYREEWDDDDDDDDDDRRKAPPKQGGSLLWLWILLGVLALVVATCGGAFYFVTKAANEVRERALIRTAELEREVQEDLKRLRPGVQNFGDTNRPGKGPAPVQPHASEYERKRPDGGDPAMGGPGPIFLDDLTPFQVSQGEWKFGRHGALGSPDNRWVSANGTFYDHSISMVPPTKGAARASFAVDGQARTLSGSVAISDYWHDNPAHSDVTFTIYKDGKQVWQSKPRRNRKAAPEAFSVDITGARVVMLETRAADSSHDAHAVWLDPLLTK